MTVPLGQLASFTDALFNLGGIFTDVSSKGGFTLEFFRTSQQTEESVTAFAYRLETLLHTIDKGNLAIGANNDLLWAGLFREIRQVDKKLSSSQSTSTSTRLLTH